MDTITMDYLETDDFYDTEIPEVAKNMVEDAIDHGILVSNLASHLARELGMEEDFCQEIAVAGLLHDIGKISMDEFLEDNDHRYLKVEKMKYVRMHPTLGLEILNKNGQYSKNICEAVHHHHENYDGSGYPSNLKGEDIPLMARILRVCDVFAALISERSYRKAFDATTAVELMIDEVKNFDMKIFLAFLSMIHMADIEELQEYAETINEKLRERRKTSA